jgi:small-conductance mechanosensitive channel
MRAEVRICLAGIVLLCLTLLCGATHAQQKSPPPPAGLTQAQYDELVKTVGKSVLQTLTDKGLVVKASALSAAAKPSETEDEESSIDKVISVLREIPGALGGYPAIWANLAQLSDRLDRTAPGGRSTSAYLGLLALAAIAALLAESTVRKLFAPASNAVARRVAEDGGVWRLASLALIDALAFLALWLVVHLALDTLFARADAQTRFARLVLAVLVTWRLFVLLVRLYLRPNLREARLAPVSDETALKLYQSFSLAILLVVLFRAWLGILFTTEAIAAATLIGSAILVPALVLIILRARSGIAEWLLGLTDDDARAKGVRTALARHWHWIALPILIPLGFLRAYEVLANRYDAPTGPILTINVIVGLLLAETLLSFIIRRQRAFVIVASGKPEASRLFPFVVRAIRLTILVAAAVLLIRTWAVDVLAFVDPEGWDSYSGAWIKAAITALLAYFAWEAVRFATAPSVDHLSIAMPGQDADSESMQLTASRLETLAPILRAALGIAIALIATLMILTDFGVNITPIIAGASVFGLAISFGSQTLVRDIVSGVFFLADDAFRVGEYVDCGRAKGTVEGFTLRSIRLRHQNGQVHTIPFGQLGQVTNFSRDWSTLKFNLRFARDVDIEKLRKVTKKVGLAMLEDPEMKDDILEPLKLQGVADIADNAMIMRFKLTVRPIKPTFIQRQGVKRLVAAFKEAGIEFATATVSVQTVGGNPAEAAAAASAALNRPN